MSKTSPGRPPASLPKRHQVRHSEDQLATWKVAAATCGLSLNDWIVAALNGEAKRSHHVPMIKREARRG